jgi:hypothetical protein
VGSDEDARVLELPGSHQDITPHHTTPHHLTTSPELQLPTFNPATHSITTTIATEIRQISSWRCELISA